MHLRNINQDSHAAKHHNITVMTLNCRSLRKKTHQLKTILDDNLVDIAVLQETWLQGDLSVYAEFKEKGFTIRKLERSGKRGGGLAVMVKTSTCQKVSPNQHCIHKGFDTIVCTLKFRNVIINIVNIYRPPAFSKSDFLVEFGNFLPKVLEMEGMLLLVGDFNLDLLSPDNITVKFSEILSSYGLLQIVNKATRESALLDLVIVQECYTDIISLFEPDSYFDSDHIPVFSRIKAPSILVNDFTERVVRDYHLLDSDFMKQTLLDSPLNNLDQDLSSSEYVNLYNSTITKIMDSQCPKKVKVFKRDISKRWFDSRLRKLKQEKRRCERALKKSPSIDHLNLYRQSRNRYTLGLKEARTEYFSNNIVKHKNDGKNLFKILNDLTGRKKESILPTEECNSAMAEKFSDFYIEKVSNIRNNIIDGEVSGTRHGIGSTVKRNVSAITQFSCFRTIDLYKLKRIIGSINKKSSCLDPAPTAILMNNMDVLYPVILNIVNSIILKSEFPKALKHAVITPILKNSKLDAEEYNSYRPVSSLPFLSKVSEKVIYEQLTVHLESNCLYAKFQSAYRKDHSCESALTKLVDDLHKFIHQGENVLLILLDSSAAFDTVDHQILLEKLESKFFISHSALQLIKSYLCNRTFSTKVNDVQSSPRPLKFGVPQGSLLGPLFYILYTSEIEQIVLNHGLKIITYADDCQIYITFRNQETKKSEKILKNCLSDIKVWMDNNFLKLNEEKTLVKMFTPNKLELSYTGTQFLDFNLLNSVKTLGVIINDNLKFTDFISKKVQTCNLHLRNLYNIRHCLDEPTRILLVTNLILSTVDYCNILLLGATDKDLRPLRLILNRAIRFILSVKFRDHITPYYKRLHFLPIRLRIKFKACLIAHKVFYGQSPIYLQEEFVKYSPTRVLREGTGRDIFMFDQDPKDQRLSSRIKREWNTLQLNTRKCDTLSLFKSKLKSELFVSF